VAGVPVKAVASRSVTDLISGTTHKQRGHELCMYVWGHATPTTYTGTIRDSNPEFEKAFAPILLTDLAYEQMD
jgi:hypothetical protein